MLPSCIHAARLFEPLFIITLQHFQVGKIGHIYRPLATDKHADTIWGSWNDAAETTDELTLTVDAAWLAAAAYPVVIDPTFGYTTAGASNTGVVDTTSYATIETGYPYTASTGDEVTGHHVRMHKTGGPACTIEAGIYTFSGGHPVTLTGSVTDHVKDNSTPEWIVVSGLTDTLTNAVVYVVALCETTASAVLHYDSGGSADALCKAERTALDPLSSTWTHNAHSTAIVSQYVTYTAGSGAARRVMVVS